MLTTTNYGLKKPEGTDVVDIQNFNDNSDVIDQALKKHDTALSDMVYQTAGGSATAITIAIKGTLVNGYPITFIASANNNGAATTINGKKLYKPGTTISPNLIAGKACTVWYNSTGDCFFIKASAEGSAIAGHVLEIDTFSNDSDTGIQGTLKNQPALVNAINVGSNGTNKYFRIPYGAYLNNNGQGYPEIWASATQIDSNIVSGNIKADANICGVQGKASVVDTAVATATSDTILSGFTAWVNGSKLTGNAKGLKTASGQLTVDISVNHNVSFTLPMQNFNVIAWIAYDSTGHSNDKGIFGILDLNILAYTSGSTTVFTTYKTSNISMYSWSGTVHWYAIGY